MSEMTSRERILAAMERRPTDRTPIDFGGGIATTIYFTAYERLRKHLGITTEPGTAVARSRTVIPDDAILERFNVDTRFLGLGAYQGGSGRRIDDDHYVDEWGTTWEKRDVHPYMNVDGPFYNKTPDMADLEAHDWPDPDNPGYYDGLRENAQKLHDTGCAVMLNLPVGIVHGCQFVRGYGDWLMDLHRHPEFAARMMDIISDHWVKVAHNALDEVGDLIDLVFFGDDMATQQATLFSPDIYRKLVKPRHARMFGAVKDRGAKLTYHCCGSVEALFDDLIEMGIDAFNPVQVAAKDMEPASLKKKYGDRLTFWGGIDTQSVLPFGTPDEVRENVRHIIDTLGAGGGYVLNSVHNIQPDVPPENIVAMFEEAASYRAN